MQIIDNRILLLTYAPCQIKGLDLLHQQSDWTVPVAQEWDGKAVRN